MPLLPGSGGVVFGKDPQRFAVLVHNSLPDAADALADVLGGHDPQVAPWKLLHEHG
jgi:hypothetical protein